MRKTLITCFLPLMALLLSYSSCKKDNKQADTNAVILASSPTGVACGWTIKIGNDTYSPTNLDDQYKQDNLKVNVTYEVLGSEFTCAWGVKLKQVHITNISKP
jgi:hypothetical protein